MYSSTSTRLDVINAALSFVGDRQVDASDESQASRLALLILPEAVNQLAADYYWYFLFKSLVPADLTYTNEKAQTVLPYLKVDSVRSISTAQQAQYLPIDSFRRLALAPMQTGQVVLYYSVDRSKVIYLNPYPTTLAQRESIEIVVYRHLLVPSTDSTTFGLPEPYVPLITLWLASRLCSRLLNDSQASQLYEMQYKAALRSHIQAEGSYPVDDRQSVF